MPKQLSPCGKRPFTSAWPNPKPNRFTTSLGSHHSTINVDSFRGLALADDIAPFIIINDNDSRAAWSFTLIHELVHIWLGQTGISNTKSEKAVEKFCNSVAGQFFLPKGEINQLNISKNIDHTQLKNVIDHFAKPRNISNSMIAYSLYLSGKINSATWKQLDSSYRKTWEDSKAIQKKVRLNKDGGPDYYTVRRHRVGANLIELVQRMMASGSLTTVKASKILGVKPTNVQKLIEKNHTLTSGQII